MSDPPADRGDEEALQESVLDWLDEIAAAEGVSREDAVQSLVSSYWQLKEVIELLDNSDVLGPPKTGGRPPESVRTAPEVRESSAPDESSELREVFEAVTEIADRLDDLEVAIEEEGPQPDDLEQRQERYLTRLDALEARFTALEEQLSDLQSQSVSTERFQASMDQQRRTQASLGQRQDDLRERVSTEFTHIRTILTHLLDARSDDEMDPAVSDLQATLRSHLAERERLETITRTANRLGVRLADCEHCGRTLDLALLDTDRCPNCEQRLVDLHVPSGLFSYFRTPVLETEDPASNR